MHLIEAHERPPGDWQPRHYRRLTKLAPLMGSSGVLGEELRTAGHRGAPGAAGAGKSRLIKMIKEACSGQMSLIKAKVAPLFSSRRCSSGST